MKAVKAKKKRIKKKKILISVLIVAVIVVISALSPFIKSGLNEFTVKRIIGSSDISTIDNVKILGHCVTINSEADTVAGVKEAIRLGADGVIVDICFRKNGTPVMCDDYSKCENAPLVEDLFKDMINESYQNVSVYLNIIQLSSLTQLNALASRYGLLSRLYLMGIDADHYGMVVSDDTIIPILLNYVPTSEDNINASSGKFTAPKCISEYGASGLVIDYKDINADLISALDDLGIPFIVDGVSSISDTGKVLEIKAENIIVSDIALTNDFLDRWKDAMQERNIEEVQSSLDALSTTKTK